MTPQHTATWCARSTCSHPPLHVATPASNPAMLMISITSYPKNKPIW